MFKLCHDAKARADIIFYSSFNEKDHHLMRAEMEKLRRDIDIIAEHLGVKFIDRSVIKKEGDKK